jgi:hypothetical protein
MAPTVGIDSRPVGAVAPVVALVAGRRRRATWRPDPDPGLVAAADQLRAALALLDPEQAADIDSAVVGVLRNLERVLIRPYERGGPDHQSEPST